MTRRYFFDVATAEDSEEILEVIEDCPFTGNVSLLYTRRSDPYSSLQREGDEVDIIVCRDNKRQKIVGVGNCAVRRLFIDGVPQKVGYLFGLRARQEYRGLPLLHRGYQFLHELHRGRDIGYYFTTILAESVAVQKMLEKKRSYMPEYRFLGDYCMYACGTGKRARSRPGYSFTQARREEVPELVEFLQSNGHRYQFFPVVEQDDLTGGEKFFGLCYRDFYLVRDKQGNLVATGAAWNRKQCKQYIVQGYGGILRILSPLLPWLSLLGYPAFPATGGMMDFCYIALWIGTEEDPESFACFLDGIAQQYAKQSFFLLGIHDRSPLREIAAHRPHILYRSKLYQVLWEQASAIVGTERIPYIECAML